MKRFRFRLEKVLRLQQHRQRLAELEQAQAFQRWYQSAQQLRALEQHAAHLSQAAYERVGQHGKAGFGSPTTPTAADVGHYWFLLADHLAILKEVLQLARQHEAQHRQAWEQRNQRRLEITRRAEALDWLRQRGFSVYRRKLRLSEQQHLDELALQAWAWHLLQPTIAQLPAQDSLPTGITDK